MVSGICRVPVLPPIAGRVEQKHLIAGDAPAHQPGLGRVQITADHHRQAIDPVVYNSSRSTPFEAAATYAEEIANQDGILVKLVTVFEAPIPQAYFQRVKPYIGEGQHMVGLMVAPHSMDGFDTFTARRAGAATRPHFAQYLCERQRSHARQA